MLACNWNNPVKKGQRQFLKTEKFKPGVKVVLFRFQRQVLREIADMHEKDAALQSLAYCKLGSLMNQQNMNK